MKKNLAIITSLLLFQTLAFASEYKCDEAQTNFNSANVITREILDTKVVGKKWISTFATLCENPNSQWAFDCMGSVNVASYPNNILPSCYLNDRKNQGFIGALSNNFEIIPTMSTDTLFVHDPFQGDQTEVIKASKYTISGCHHADFYRNCNNEGALDESWSFHHSFDQISDFASSLPYLNRSAECKFIEKSQRIICSGPAINGHLYYVFQIQ